MIDAECTHDGSISHLTKWKNEDKGGQKNVWEGKLKGLETLQQELISNGFRM